MIEIVKSLFSTAKYQRGIVSEQCIFGGYDPATKEGFLLPVPRLNAATVMPLIIQWFWSRTGIWSDMWGTYNGIAAQGFQHDVVNHQYNFVDPNTGVTTSQVEAMWQWDKAKFKSIFSPKTVAWFQITWQSSCGIRDSKNIFIFTFGLKLTSSNLYELHDKKKRLFKLRK